MARTPTNINIEQFKPIAIPAVTNWPLNINSPWVHLFERRRRIQYPLIQLVVR